MEASSIGILFRIINWMLNKAGYKIVPIDSWIVEEVNVQLNIVDTDPDMQKEKSTGAIFRWSDVRHTGYEYYEVMKGNTKERYKSGRHYLWIKRVNLNDDK